MEKQWTAVIKPKKKMFDLDLKETFKYRDLIWLFVVRNLKTRYKQTVLGPLWFVIQPLMSSVIHTLIFGTIAGLSTDGVPQYLFYLLGSVSWTIFSGCLVGTSNTFVSNSHVFGKVYFPRLTAPISTALTQMFNFAIQFAIFLATSLVFFLRGEWFQITWVAALLPLLVLQLSMLGVGLGIIISSMTTKYRDLQILVGFGISLLMYLTPVVYTANSLGARKLYVALMLNPVSPAIELFRNGWLGTGFATNIWMYWGISWITTIAVFLLGVVIFNRVEKNFMDTV